MHAAIPKHHVAEHRSHYPLFVGAVRGDDRALPQASGAFNKSRIGYYLPSPDAWQIRGIGSRFRDKPQHVLGVFLRFIILALGIGVTGSVALGLGLSSLIVPSGPARKGHPKAVDQPTRFDLCLVCIEICTGEIGNPPTTNNLEHISNKPHER